jgi:capsular polysaccharide transport system permease protein
MKCSAEVGEHNLRREQPRDFLKRIDMEVLPIFAKPPKSTGEDEATDIVVRKPRRYVRPSLLFLLVVVLPVLVATIYFGFIASDVYISESQFVVRSPDKPSPTGLGAILQTAGFKNASDEADAAQSFAVSRDALRGINRNDAFEKAYTRPSISIVDRFDPLRLYGSFEHLYGYFQDKVSLQIDSTTSITTLAVRAYTPQDAYRFNEQLLGMTESRVNKLNEPGRQDLVQYAQADVDTAKARSQAAAMALAAYRNQSGIVDPTLESQAELQMISNLQTQLIAARTELAQVQRYAPENPRIPVLQTQIATIQGQMDQELGKVTGGHKSLSGSAVQYQRLALESDFADKQLEASLASLEQARQEAHRKQVYVERVVEPNFPDAPMEPLRLRGIFATLVISLIAFGIFRMLLAGVKEHAQ